MVPMSKVFSLANLAETVGLLLSNCRPVGAWDPHVDDELVEKHKKGSQGSGWKLVRIGRPHSSGVSRDSSDNLRHDSMFMLVLSCGEMERLESFTISFFLV